MTTNKLSILAFIFFCIFVFASAGAPNSAAQGCSDHLVDPKISIITFEDVAPADYVLEENFGGIGIDHNGWVYHCIDGYYSSIGIEDTAVFRYNSNTGEKQFLGTMREISEAEGNLEPGEEIAKIHAPVLEYNGKMYFASHSFHRKDEIQRGGHFYSYDLTTGMWQDLSKHDSEGVSAPGQGIITMDILRNHNKLVGFTFPKGEIITYDLATNKTTNHGRPISSDPPNVARHIAATDEGKVYFSYAKYNTPLYEFDVNTGNFADTGFDIHYGWLAGNTTNKTRTTVYLLDWLGHIYSINVSSGAITEIGNIIPAGHADYSVSYLHGLALSHDDTRLYTIPEIRDTNDNILGTLLYEYEVETGQKKYHINLLELAGIKRYAIGPAMADDGSIFYHNHNYSTGEVKLVKVYSNCAPAVCSDGTPANQCSKVTGSPWYCNGSLNLVEDYAQCGCENPDTDTDSDGHPDCMDNCPNDSGKTDPGACGCGVADTDSDGDGTPDCDDECPFNPAKTLPGICGCGVSDLDTDLDGTSDCNDNCPSDPGKTKPGICGCSVADIDTDFDGTPDCADTDDDNDGLPDGWEIRYGLNPLVDDAPEDADGDGYSNLEEYQGGSDPTYRYSLPGINGKLLMPRYRLYNPNNFHHHYTTDANEYNALENLGWIQEGAGCYLLNGKVTIESVEAVPYYRLYNPSSFEHHWTTDANEYNVLGTLSWIREGADGYVFASPVTGSEPLYRLYNPNTGLHQWTIDTNEKNVLIGLGFIDEGIACYVFP